VMWVQEICDEKMGRAIRKRKEGMGSGILS
jgi:hypothetical protein